MMPSFGRSWWFGLFWKILAVGLLGYCAIDYAHHQSQGPAPASVAKPDAPQKHFSLFIPWQAVTLPHAVTYNLRGGAIQCFGEGLYPDRYIACTVLSNITVGDRLFHVVQISPHQGYNQACYVFEDKDLVKVL